jgi:membrane associated rhomboid family serine protease
MRLGWVEVARSQRRAEIDQQALVLAAVGIEHLVVPGPGFLVLEVAPEDALRARGELEAYARERARDRRPAPRPVLHPYGTEAAMAFVAVMLFFFIAPRSGLWGIDWLDIGAADSGAIRAGAWWRTITALALHADVPHIAGNLLFGVLFSLPLTRVLGSGLAWLAILLSGAFGNEFAALLRPDDHSAIGASTALFGALGLLAAQARSTGLAPWQSRIRRWAPFGAGLMLLAFLGFQGERTDVLAHVMGFAVGSVLGFALSGLGTRIPQGAAAQLGYGALTLALFALAWLLAVSAQ